MQTTSLRHLASKLRRMAGRRPGTLTDHAVETWQISPAETRPVPPVICLPGQAERITRTAFAPLDVVLRSLRGDPAEHIPATIGYRLRDVDFVDGVLYSGKAELHLRRQTRYALRRRRPDRSLSGALYETWVGNRWFGNWLLDDCLSYRLAEQAGHPVTSMPERGGHVPRYEQLLSMAPERIGDVHFDELILFDDHHNNRGRIARAQDMRRRLLSGRTPQPNPGVFLYRGRSGDARILENEDEIAGKLQAQYGFRVMFPEDHTVDELLDACGATRVVAGIEGSQLNHGLAAMPPGGTLLTIQPADRTTTAMKLLTDRWQQRFALLVGTGTAGSFRIAWDEVQRTLALIL
ncbi:glycosyltransferase family 61 protein [Paracoccus salsus]|uniref:glycosyltransferase family 61 protein n=1 Tax=Paracoccus salsus TaxID=2911061 RepID=UPI001F31092D|nr:glycosyltransferase family 61 protein [Paracoccus salsus]MCF3974881.1 glycosyltransferase family 61 protein [Paracoccus salsus]